jgi:hypothetical protein
VWPSASSASLPGYMQLRAACVHCACRCAACHARGEGAAAAAAATAATCRGQHRVLAGLLVAADAAGGAGASSLASLLRTRLCCSGGVDEGGLDAGCAPRAAGGDATARPPLHHAHAVAQLAEWTGLAAAVVGGELGGALAATRAAPPPWLATALGVFDLALRCVALDPGQRLTSAAAAAHPALAPPADAAAAAAEWGVLPALAAAVARARAHARSTRDAARRRAHDAGAAFLGAAFGGAAGWQPRGVGGEASDGEDEAAGEGGAGGDTWASLYAGPQGDLGEDAGGAAASPATPRGTVASSPQSASGLRHAAQGLHV